MAEFFLGVDLGGTKILTVVADHNGNILASEKRPTEAEQGPEKVINNIYATVLDVLEKSSVRSRDIIKMGIGSPGPIGISEGMIYMAPNLYWENVPIVKLLEEKVNIPVILENDANAAALAEKWFGAGKDVDNLLYITVSTGIGGGIIINKKIYHGVNDGAGEVGHMIIDPAGPRCGCGNPGCLEAIASGTAINRMAGEAIRQDKDTLLKELFINNQEKIDGMMIADAARRGDRIALQIWHKAGRYLGIGLANLINIFNPEMIVLGGGVMNAADLIFRPMEESLKEYSFESNYKSVRICQALLGEEAGVRGAIAVAMGERLLR